MHIRTIVGFSLALVVVVAVPAGAAAPEATAAVRGAAYHLQVGAARVDETGPFGPSQTGKYDHEHVYARAIVLDNGSARAALISYDGPEADFDMATTRAQVAQTIGSTVDNVLITHTHTHSSASAPMGTPGAKAAPAVPSPTILQAVRTARSRLQPATLAFGTGALYLNVNRDAIDPATRKWTQGSNPEGPIDRSVAVLSFAKPDGRPLAVYVTYAMHPIDGYVLGVVSGDFPEAMSRYVEKAFGDDTVVAFSQGPSGDVNPLYLRPSTNAMATRAGNPITGFEMNRESSEGPLRVADMGVADQGGKPAPPADPKAIDALFRFIDSEGQIFGEEVIRVMSGAQPGSSDVRIQGAQSVVSCPGRLRTNGSPFDPKTREASQAAYSDTAPVAIHVGMIGLGTVALTSVNGEIYTLIGRHAKDAAPMHDTVIATLANERVPGYMPDDSAYGHETFQVLDSRLKPGCAEQGIVHAVVDLENRYLKGQ